MKAFQQGDFDGLCGLYAVLNAIQHSLEVSGQRALHEELFEIGADAITRSRFPSALWKGLTLEDVLNIAKAVVLKLRNDLRFDFEVWRPFKVRSFATVSAYVLALDELWTETKVSFVLGIDWAGGRGGHWTVLKTIASDEIGLLDSCGEKHLDRRTLTLSPNARNKHRICTRETIAFRLTDIEGRSIYAKH